MPRATCTVLSPFRARRLVTAAVASTFACIGVLALAQAASADPLAGARAQAAQISAQLQADGAQLDRTGTEYGLAEQHLAQLDTQIAQSDTAIAYTEHDVTAAKARLRQIALNAYITGSTSTGIDTLFSSNAAKSEVVQEYQSVASGNLSDALDSYRTAQASLVSQQQQLRAMRSQAQAAVGQAAAAQQAARQAQASQQAELDKMNGQIAVLVQQQQQAEQQAQHAAFLARLQAEQAQAAQAAQATRVALAVGGTVEINPPVGIPAGPLPSAGGAARAVQAAESQVGTPYQWGGESPGAGFDCSGLTQWSWAQAGVSIPRVAADQYAAILHVPLDQIQPGDLLFWNDGTSTIQHVAIYVGNDDVVTAPETGQTVRVQPIWNNGLVGAGRP